MSERRNGGGVREGEREGRGQRQGEGREKSGFLCLRLARSPALRNVLNPGPPLWCPRFGVCMFLRNSEHSCLLWVRVSIRCNSLRAPLFLSLHNRKPSVITRSLQNCECFLLSTARAASSSAQGEVEIWQLGGKCILG